MCIVFIVDEIGNTVVYIGGFLAEELIKLNYDVITIFYSHIFKFIMLWYTIFIGLTHVYLVYQSDYL